MTTYLSPEDRASTAEAGGRVAESLAIYRDQLIQRGFLGDLLGDLIVQWASVCVVSGAEAIQRANTARAFQALSDHLAATATGDES